MKVKIWHVLGVGTVAGAIALLWPKTAKAEPARFTPAPPQPQPQPQPVPVIIDPPTPRDAPNPPNLPGSDWRPSSPNVSWTQSRLIELGYDPGPVDGIFGPRTSAALRAYQRDVGLPETGDDDEDTIWQLQGNAPAERPDYQSDF